MRIAVRRTGAVGRPKQVIDPGDSSAAPGTDAYLVPWRRVLGALGSARVDISFAR